MKVSRTVWRRGKGGDNIKTLPIPIIPGGGDAHDLVPADAHDPEPAVHRRDPRQKPGSGGGLRGSDARHGGQQPNR